MWLAPARQDQPLHGYLAELGHTVLLVGTIAVSAAAHRRVVSTVDSAGCSMRLGCARPSSKPSFLRPAGTIVNWSLRVAL